MVQDQAGAAADCKDRHPGIGEKRTCTRWADFWHIEHSDNRALFHEGFRSIWSWIGIGRLHGRSNFRLIVTIYETGPWTCKDQKIFNQGVLSFLEKLEGAEPLWSFHIYIKLLEFFILFNTKCFHSQILKTFNCNKVTLAEAITLCI